MQTGLRGRDLISLQEWTREEVDTVLEVAARLKLERALGIRHPLLRDNVLAMLFFFSSTRTRASFEAGMAQLGGHAQFIESRTTQIAHGDTPKEIGEILGRYNDGIAIRHSDWGVGNRYIREVAAASRVPVLNMQCDLFHPHQILADLLTIREKKGTCGAGRSRSAGPTPRATRSRSASRSTLTLATTRFGMNVRLVHPPEYRLPPEYVDQAAENARRSGGSLELMDDFEAGFAGSDVIYAKCWGAPRRVERRGREPRSRKYTDWITDERRMALAAPDAIYMHPLPADRNIEVADAVIDGPHSVVYDEAENRLHAQKAVMALTSERSILRRSKSIWARRRRPAFPAPTSSAATPIPQAGGSGWSTERRRLGRDPGSPRAR